MRKQKFERLFKSLAILSPALNSVCERVVDSVKDDDSLTQKEKDSVIASAKELFFHSSEIKDYVRRQYPELDYIHDGREKYDQIKSEAKKYVDSLLQ
ncbi:hypothetical protein ACFO4O_13955 [Glaciecola siphonariae]|uniref:Uncharacterized protein n=1 Tax=Glaciecola siphonariae TaxID=521012 RepID=A0ABV9M0V8_9ALTE